MFRGCVWGKQCKGAGLSSGLPICCAACWRRQVWQRDGNFRPMKGHSAWHHFARIFVPQKPNTSTTVTGHADRNETAGGGRRICLNLPPSCTRSPLTIPAPITLSLSAQTPWYPIQSALLTNAPDNGFQILQGGLCMCQTRKWKANTSPPPPVPTYL